MITMKRWKKSNKLLSAFFTQRRENIPQEEFETALRQFKETGSPLIYTYFKSGGPEPLPNDQQALDLAKFKKRLEEYKAFLYRLP